jgi:hypothetical protein
MKILRRRPLQKPIILAAGDKLIMSYVEIDGVVRTERVTTFAVISPHRSIRVEEAVLVEGEVDGRYAIGGLVIEASPSMADLQADATAAIAIDARRHATKLKSR